MPSEVAEISLRGKSHHENAYVGTWHPSSPTDEFVKSIMEHGCIRGFVERDEWRPHAHDGACPRCRIVRIAACRLPQCGEAGIGDLFARRPVGSAWRICSTKPEVCAYNVLSPRIERARGRRLARGGKQRAPETFGAQPGRRVKTVEDFSIWIRCNPLKSPDSDE